MTPTQQQRAKIAVASLFGTGALLSLAWLIWQQSFPSPLWLWLLLVAAFVFVSINAVEVDDRLVVSPSGMVAMTAAVAFGPGSAALGVATMALLGGLRPKDFTAKRIFEPIANSSQLVISFTLSVLVLEIFLPEGPIGSNDIWLVALGSAAAAVVHFFINFRLVHFAVFRVFGRKQVQPWSDQVRHLLPGIGLGFLGGMLGVAYRMVGPVTLPSILVIFFVGYLTFASYSRLREAQESTLRGFVKALEAKDLYTRGHTERVAYFAELIGSRLGFNGSQLKRLRWAALIHDVGKLAVPRELISKRGRLSTDEYAEMQTHVHHVEDLLAEVEFLKPMVEIATNHHAHYDGNGYHGGGHVHGVEPSLEACILSVADSFDAMTSTRSYRVALSQDYAFGELRAKAGSQFAPTIVEAFIEALAGIGEVYGSPNVNSEEEARRRAEGVSVG